MAASTLVTAKASMFSFKSAFAGVFLLITLFTVAPVTALPAESIDDALIDIGEEDGIRGSR